jgi:hypothetical protein
MSIACNALLARVQDMIDDHSSETKSILLGHLNALYMIAAADHPWYAMTGQVTNPGSVLPGDLERVLFIEDGLDKVYFKRGYPQQYSNRTMYNWWQNYSTGTPLLTGTDGVSTANSTTFTSAAAGFTSAMVGEYIRIDENRGVYKIAGFNSASSITLQDAYRGAADTALYFEVRPEGTKQIIYKDENAAAITSATRILWYLRKPLPLYNDYDKILLPGECDFLRIALLKLMQVTQKYDNDSLKQVPEYVEAYAQTKSLEPVPDRFVAPRDHLGSRFSFGRTRVYTPQSIHRSDY